MFKCLRANKIDKQIKFQEDWSELVANKSTQKQSWTNYLRQT